MSIPGPDVIFICKQCGQPYHPNSTRQKCCNRPIKVPCAVCGKLMDLVCTIYPQKETCSKKCSIELGNMKRWGEAQKLTKICQYCGKEFHPKKSIQEIYCEGPHFATCEVCGKQFEIVGRIDSVNKTCSDECRYISAKRNTDMKAMAEHWKATMVEKYGVKNAMYSQEFKDKIKETNKARYGAESYTQTKEYWNRHEATCLKKYGAKHHWASKEIIEKRAEHVREKYGVDCVFQADEVKEKIKKTNLEKYGVDNPTKSLDLQEKIRQNNLAKYGVEHPMMLPEYQEKARRTNFEKYGFAAPTQAHIKNIDNWYKFVNDPRGYINTNYETPPRVEELADDLGVSICTIDKYLDRYDSFDCIRRAKSLMEEEVVNYIKEVSPECKIITNNHTILKGKEVDIYLPDYNFAIECDPTVTHNSSFPDPWGVGKKSINYHKDKTDKCLSQGIFLMHIFGYEWTHSKDIIKSMITNILGCNTKIYARKCQIIMVNQETAIKFLKNNHRQGYASSPINLGLQYNGELVSLMTFSKMRAFGIDKTDLTDCWELVRFCNKLNTSVVGGASKLFKHFISHYNPKEIRSFSDRAHTKGTLYSTLGFVKLRESDANYVWVNIVDDKAYHRINAQKKNIKKFLKDDTIDLTKSEREIMESHGYARVYDSGTITWQWLENI